MNIYAIRVVGTNLYFGKKPYGRFGPIEKTRTYHKIGSAKGLINQINNRKAFYKNLTCIVELVTFKLEEVRNEIAK